MDGGDSDGFQGFTQTLSWTNRLTVSFQCRSSSVCLLLQCDHVVGADAVRPLTSCDVSDPPLCEVPSRDQRCLNVLWHFLKTERQNNLTLTIQSLTQLLLFTCESSICLCYASFGILSTHHYCGTQGCISRMSTDCSKTYVFISVCLLSTFPKNY